ncbi:MAG: cytochrome c biogenesis CcdA family protein [Aggregatilineales bacterium]
MNSLPLALAFSAGVLASVNPCAFVMLPGFVSYYLGGKESDDVSSPGQLGAALRLGVAGTAGFMAVFVSVGAVFSAGGQFLFRALPWFSVITGIALIAIGVWTLLGRTLPVPLPTIAVTRLGRGPQAMFLYGVAYGLASLGCALPIFLSVVAGALTVDGIGQGVLMFVSYSLGMGAVLVSVALGAALFKGAVARRMRGLLPYVKALSAVALIGAGLYLTYQAMFNPLGGF